MSMKIFCLRGGRFVQAMDMAALKTIADTREIYERVTRRRYGKSRVQLNPDSMNTHLSTI